MMNMMINPNESVDMLTFNLAALAGPQQVW